MRTSVVKIEKQWRVEGHTEDCSLRRGLDLEGGWSVDGAHPTVSALSPSTHIHKKQSLSIFPSIYRDTCRMADVSWKSWTEKKRISTSGAALGFCRGVAFSGADLGCSSE